MMMSTKWKIVTASLAVVIGLSVAAGDNLLVSSNLGLENGWQCWQDEAVNTAGGTSGFSHGAIVVKTVKYANPQNTAIQVYKPVELSAEQSYRFTFLATAECPGSVSVGYCLPEPPFTYYAMTEVKLIEGPHEYECILKLGKDAAGKNKIQGSLRFLFGAFPPATITVSHGILEKME